MKKRSIVDIPTPLFLVASYLAIMSRKILREMDKLENCRESRYKGTTLVVNAKEIT